VLARILYDPPEAPNPLEPSITAAINELVLGMLAKRPGERPADGQALVAELDHLRLASAPTDDARFGPKSSVDVGDQVLVCVVLAKVPGSLGESDTAASQFDSIGALMHGFDCPLARLADGSWLMTIPPRVSAVDQVRIATRSAMALRERLPAARVAIATGRAPLRSLAPVGEAVDRAAQLLESNPPSGVIRLDSVTAGLLDTRFVTEMRDGVAHLTGEVANLDESRPLLGKPTPCVGRELELTQLESLVASSIDDASPKAAVVMGPPGIGKSRLRHELSRRVRERYPATALIVGYGDPMTAGSPYVLLADALRRYAEIRAVDDLNAARDAIRARLCRNVDAAQRNRVAEFLGELAGIPFPDESSPPLLAARADARVMSEQIALAFSDWVAAECARYPLVIVLEDVQWGDALTARLLESALRELRDGCLFVLALGRPEIEHTFPQLFGTSRALSMTLAALGKKAAERLVRGALGDGVSDDSVDRIVEAAAGSPLFLEEIVRAAASGRPAEVPETVLAMLQARLSRLEPGARALLRAASVFGETFWDTGVAEVCSAWSQLDEPRRWFAELVAAEIVEQHRTSRFPGHAEYGFRHALLCDAARSLLTDTERRSGHRAAGAFLQRAGEADAMVLAHHADEAAEAERATGFWLSAARSSLAKRDIDAALSRAEQGIGRGARGEVLGELLAVKCAALYALGRLVEAADAGVPALELVTRGGASWCSTIEKLLQVFPNAGDSVRAELLADALLSTVPPAEARMDYVRVTHARVFAHAITGQRARGEAWLERIAKLGANEDSYDVVTRGHARLWRCCFSFLLGRDPLRSLELADKAIEDLLRSRMIYRVSFAHTLRSSMYWSLGDLEQAERCGLEAYSLAKESNDDFHAALGSWYVALALAEQPVPEKLEKAQRFAEGVRPAIGPLDEALSLALTARIALTRNDLAGAEADARKARAPLLALPPWGLYASAHLLEALVRLGRAADAAAIAREDIELMDRVGSPMFTEILFRVSAGEALLADGDRARAHESLAIALREIALRAAAIPDTLGRERFHARYENRRALELARALGVGT
jgi:hypothetical protein